VQLKLANMEEPNIITPGTSIATPKVIFIMADYGHDPTGAYPHSCFSSMVMVQKR
jgi:hypothetical protein